MHEPGAAADVTLRDARPADRPAVAAVTLGAYGQYAATMQPQAWAGLESAVRAALGLDDDAVHRIVAERGGEVVGSVMLYPPAADAYGGYTRAAPWPELRLLAVSPAARGAGVGRGLVEECVRRARAMGAPALGLHTSRSMAVAIGLYERMGFVRAPAHDFQPPGAELVTAYQLPLR